MMWVEFFISAGLLVVAATKLAEFGDVIALRTGLGRLFIGTILLAGATSLPEFLTSINSFQQGSVNLAAGNLFGSNMFNMFMLSILDISFHNQRILRVIYRRHALTGVSAAILISMTLLFMVANLDLQIGWVGVDSLLLVLGYVGLVYVIRKNTGISAVIEDDAPDESTPGLITGLFGFGLAVVLLVIVSPWLVESSLKIADATGLSNGFIGTTLVGITTSLPELVTTLAAVRIGAYDLAVGNLFGSNMFNVFALGISDLFYTQDRLIGAIDPVFMLAGLVGMVMTLFGLFGNLARLERRFWLFELDGWLLFLMYWLGLFLVYIKG